MAFVLVSSFDVWHAVGSKCQESVLLLLVLSFKDPFFWQRAAGWGACQLLRQCIGNKMSCLLKDGDAQVHMQLQSLQIANMCCLLTSAGWCSSTTVWCAVLLFVSFTVPKDAGLRARKHRHLLV